MIFDDREHSDLASLVAIFYRDEKELGTFHEVDASDAPSAYRKLLDHHSHMTVALEESHDSPVDLRVFALHESGIYYSRKIALRRRSDGRAVLFGVVRLNSTLLPADAMETIRRQTEPLGLVLIRYNVLREVERLRLWRIEPGAELRSLFDMDSKGGHPIYGRTALIHCNSMPAIELLEIVHVHEPDARSSTP